MNPAPTSDAAPAAATSGIDPELAQYYQRREVWRNKPHIRLVYARMVALMRPFLPPGPLLEVGSGSGLLKELLPEVELSDVVPLPWLDRVMDCMHMPFAANSLGGILGIDMLHHVPRPHDFLSEAARVLRPGGRIVLVEPYITAASYIAYKLFHHEPVYFRDYHPPVPMTHRVTGSAASAPAATVGEADPWEGNLAVANLVFDRDWPRWPQMHPNLRLIHRRTYSFLDFQLALGFKPRGLVPYWMFQGLVHLDDWFWFLMPLIGFRVFVVLEKFE